MKVRFRLFGEFKELVDQDEIGIAITLGVGLQEALRDLAAKYPRLDGKLLDGQGLLQPRLLVFLNGRNIRTLEPSDLPLKEGDTVVLAPLVGGG